MQRKTVFSALALALALGGCDSFDPLDKFQDWDIMGSKKPPLQGERRAVFPEGVPGVAKGVPPELVKGYEAPAEPPQVIEEKKAKPKPKVAARPKPKQPAQQQQKQQQQTAPAQATTQPTGANAPWPEPPPPPSNAAWPAIPGSQPTWPSQAPPPPQTR